MKRQILKEIIQKKSSKKEFAVLTNLINGNSEIFEFGKFLSKDFEISKKDSWLIGVGLTNAWMIPSIIDDLTEIFIGAWFP